MLILSVNFSMIVTSVNFSMVASDNKVKFYDDTIIVCLDCHEFMKQKHLLQGLSNSENCKASVF